MKNKRAVEETYTDSDGFWINLKPGYQVDGCHAVHEDTRAATIKRMADVQPCHCEDCE